VLLRIAWISGEIAVIGPGIVILRDGDVLIGVAAIGFGIAVIGVGIAILHRTGIFARVLASLAFLPETPTVKRGHHSWPPGLAA
jgi:hypothetical protein